MMVEHEMGPRVVGHVGRNIPASDVHDAVLDVLGMNEQDLIDDVQLLEEHGGHQAVKITTRYQPILSIGHAAFFGIPVNEDKFSARTVGVAASSRRGGPGS
jgi:hypothetical protein